MANNYDSYCVLQKELIYIAFFMVNKIAFKMTTSVILLFVIVFGVYYFFGLKDYSKKEIRQPEKIEDNLGELPVEKPHPDTIPAMSQKEFLGDDLKLGKILTENEFYTRYHITYTSEGLTISGIMNIPKGIGPFPVLILNHGYIDPKVYTNGQGLKREQDYFARNGYAVLHSDYRNHAQSDFDPGNEVRPRSGYVEDVLNAISAIKKSDLEKLDKENIGMLGHSMGGGITENVMVTKPDIAKAFVLLAPINANYKVNFDKWVKVDSDFSGIPELFYETYGTYEEKPELWEAFSAINYIDRITSPVMLHQGTEDSDVPVQWSRDFSEALKKAGKDITYYEYPGEGHIFYNAQNTVMQRTLEFFDNYLKK